VGWGISLQMGTISPTTGPCVHCWAISWGTFHQGDIFGRTKNRGHFVKDIFSRTFLTVFKSTVRSVSQRLKLLCFSYRFDKFIINSYFTLELVSQHRTLSIGYEIWPCQSYKRQSEAKMRSNQSYRESSKKYGHFYF
jgi:hypothetical protein